MVDLFIVMVGEFWDKDVKFFLPRDDQDMQRYLDDLSDEKGKPVTLFKRIDLVYPDPNRAEKRRTK